MEGGTVQRAGETIVEFGERLLVAFGNSLHQQGVYALAFIWRRGFWQARRGHSLAIALLQTAISFRHGVNQPVGETGESEM